MKHFVRFSFAVVFVFISAKAFGSYSISSDDGITRALSRCASSDICLIPASIAVAPLFPWLQYPLDDMASVPQLRRFSRVSADMNFLLSKTNEKYSGYKIGGVFYKKWVGLALAYDTYNNGELDDTMWSADFVLRLIPRRHFQPKISLGWERIITDKISGSGFRFSFFNYDVYFTRKFGMTAVNYIGWIKGHTIVSGDLGFEYYFSPTISFKALMIMKYFYSEFLYGVQTGLSIKL